LITEI